MGRPYCQAMGGKREVGGLWRLAKKLKREEPCQNMLLIRAHIGDHGGLKSGKPFPS